MDNVTWVKIVLDVVEILSSEEFQTRVWLKGQGPEVSSFIEADCQFFDSQIDTLVDTEWRQVGLTETQRDYLTKLRDALKSFERLVPDAPNDRDIISHPEWPKIRSLAQKVLDVFKDSKWQH